MDPNYLTEFYDKVRKEEIEPELIKSMHKLEPTPELKKFYMDMCEDEVAKSLKKLQEDNERSRKGFVVTGQIILKVKKFFKTLFAEAK